MGKEKILKTNNLIRYVRASSQLAAVLEVSGWPKPGNVHRTKDHFDTRYEHFLAGSIMLGSSAEEAAVKGSMAASGRLDLSKIGVGRLVKKAHMRGKSYYRQRKDFQRAQKKQINRVEK